MLYFQQIIIKRADKIHFSIPVYPVEQPFVNVFIKFFPCKTADVFAEDGKSLIEGVRVIRFPDRNQLPLQLQSFSQRQGQVPSQAKFN